MWELEEHMAQFRNCEVKISLPDMVSGCYSHSEDNDHLEEPHARDAVTDSRMEKKKNKILVLHFQFLLALFILLCIDVDDGT